MNEFSDCLAFVGVFVWVAVLIVVVLAYLLDNWINGRN